MVALLYIHANVNDARKYVGSDCCSLETDVSISVRKGRINEHLVAKIGGQFAAKDLQIFDRILI